MTTKNSQSGDPSANSRNILLKRAKFGKLQLALLVDPADELDRCI